MHGRYERAFSGSLRPGETTAGGCDGAMTIDVRVTPTIQAVRCVDCVEGRVHVATGGDR